MDGVSYTKKGVMNGYTFGGIYKFPPDEKIDDNKSSEGIIINGMHYSNGMDIIVRTKYGTLLKVDQLDAITVLQELE